MFHMLTIWLHLKEIKKKGMLKYLCVCVHSVIAIFKAPEHFLHKRDKLKKNSLAKGKTISVSEGSAAFIF